MGNNGSSSRDQQAASVCSNGLLVPEGTNRVYWSQSFPRELARHRSQPTQVVPRKVLPGPSNQRLRATDNGNIIHNGGTISGRRAPTFASSRDLAKRNEQPFRERTGSGSNLVEHRPRKVDRNCCRYRDVIPASGKLNKFDSEPDLRCSPDHGPRDCSLPDRSSPASNSSCHRYGKEAKERCENRYKARKKYKAPAPPVANSVEVLVDNYTVTNESHSRFEHSHHHRQVQPSVSAPAPPPPRRSRLFKTRAESRKSQVNWQLASAGLDRERSRSRTGEHPENEPAADRCRLRPADSGKNTLLRSMSSPEFQAELIQVARKVRDKLDSHCKAFFPSDQQRNEAKTTRNDNREKIDRGVDCDAVGKPRQRERTCESAASIDAARACANLNSVDQRQPEDPNKSNVTSRDRYGTDAVTTEKSEGHSKNNGYVGETNNYLLENCPGREQDERTAPAMQSVPKTFYFGMNECPSGDIPNDEVYKFQDREDARSSVDTTDDTDDNEKTVVENISLKLRPTLPKKQLEIPRFSPSAAWRLLSALETPGPSMSTASEELPVMFEERIERLSRPPPLFPLSLGPRSWHDKSGDSGISGDAGAANEDSLDVSTINRMKTTATRPTWTPQQDLGEESSSDAGVDSPPPLPTALKYHSARAHVFSLSLPRDDSRRHLCTSDTKAREPAAFNSLQKLKRSVSGAFGIGSHERQRKSTRDVLDDNWLLSSSAPTSLQHNHRSIEPARISPSVWKSFARQDRLNQRAGRDNGNNNERVVDDRGDGDNVDYDNADDDDDDSGGDDEDVDDDDEDHDDEDNDDEDEEDDDDDDDDEDDDDEVNGVDDNLAEDEDEGEDEYEEEDVRVVNGIEHNEKASDMLISMKPPSFSYLTPGGHVMYLPGTNEAEHRVQHLNGRKISSIDCVRRTTTIREQNGTEEIGYLGEISSLRLNNYEEGEGDDGEENKDGDPLKRRSKNAKRSVSRENINQSKQKRASTPPFSNDRTTASSCSLDAKGTKPQRKNASRNRRFTFQSTVRQIERRRLAEKLSREAEAKERQRKGELEAMRKVEEEFQRKRAKEKANIRQQLRLFKEMEENFNSLSNPDWDSSQLSRADPDGAPSSAASSPNSLPSGNMSVTTTSKCFTADEFSQKKEIELDSSKRSRTERKGYRPKYYDWSPDTVSHLDYKQTTVHPKIVCDIPKSSPIFVDINVHPSKPVTSNSTPKLDNYRKDFAHGTVVTRTSFASSDSELSQPNTRPHSRQTGVKSKPHRARSGSRGRSEDAATSEEDLPAPVVVKPTKHPGSPINDFILSGVQPFTKQKAYRPISFNPRPPPPIPS
ncbi:uncharacterized protein LOC143430245 [Xylocopa sonorina]|uniref:uncharacterized protein LOC143430245 n=1 Tax=Xylocopa sonorina TaxID=1818115 RepID=UPI00403B043A